MRAEPQAVHCGNVPPLPQYHSTNAMLRPEKSIIPQETPKVTKLSHKVAKTESRYYSE